MWRRGKAMPTIEVGDFRLEYNKAIAFDCETTGLYVHKGARVFATVLYSDTGDCKVLREEGAYLESVRAEGFGSPTNKRILHAILENPDVLKVGWNIGFDWRMITATYGIELQWPWADAQVAISLLDEKAFPFRLKQCSAAYLRKDGKPLIEPGSDSEVKTWIARNRQYCHTTYGCEPNYSHVPWEIMGRYIEDDGKMTMYMWYLLKGGLERDNMMPTFNTEMYLVPVLIDMHNNGLPVNEEYLESSVEKALSAIDYQYSKIKAEVGYTPNQRSPKQMREFMYEKLGLECLDFTKTGNKSCGKNALKRHAPNSLVIRRLRRIRKLEAFTKISKQILSAICPDGKIHPSYRQTGARTGRMSAAEPPIQQMPREGSIKNYSVRDCFISNNYYTYHADYKQVEMVDFADYSQDKTLISMFLNEVDAHTGTAERIKHVMGNSSEVTKEDRFRAKTLNFAIIYGAGDKTTMETINQDDNLQEMITMGQTRALRRAYLEGFPGVNRLKELTAHQIAEFGCVVDRFGRTHRLGSSEWYKAINWLIQGGCGTLMKRALVRGYHCLNWWNRKHNQKIAEQYVTVHDEAGIRISKKLPESDAIEILSAYCASFLGDKNLFCVPLKCDVEQFNPTWGKLIDIDVEPTWDHPSAKAGNKYIADATGVKKWWMSTNL